MAGRVSFDLDHGVRRRLLARFGDIEPWFDALPGQVALLAERWNIEPGSPIPRGSVAVVIRCRTADGGAVLKLSPDRVRLAGEAAALRSWQAGPVPAVIEFDKTIGALLLEAIEPGTPLAELPTYPANAKLTPLFKSLHQPKTSDRGFPPLERRVTQLFESWEKQRASRAELRELVPPEIFDRGRRLAIRLAREPAPATLLHGDLTPANILDGGSERGLVAIDPAPCFGDPAFDTIDLLFWKADRVETITTRAQRLAATIGAPAERMLDWCTAFAGMALLDLADLGRAVEPQVEELMALAAHAPSAQVPSGR